MPGPPGCAPSHGWRPVVDLAGGRGPAALAWSRPARASPPARASKPRKTVPTARVTRTSSRLLAPRRLLLRRSPMRPQRSGQPAACLLGACALGGGVPVPASRLAPWTCFAPLHPGLARLTPWAGACPAPRPRLAPAVRPGLGGICGRARGWLDGARAACLLPLLEGGPQGLVLLQVRVDLAGQAELARGFGPAELAEHAGRPPAEQRCPAGRGVGVLHHQEDFAENVAEQLPPRRVQAAATSEVQGGGVGELRQGRRRVGDRERDALEDRPQEVG